MSALKAIPTILRHRARRSNARRARRGITLVEILVSVVLLTVAAGGAMKAAGGVATQMGGGARHTTAASLAQTRLDSLSSLSCAQLTNGLFGTATHRGVKENWNVYDGRNIKMLTVTLTIPRRTQQPVYTTVIPCRD